MRREAKKMQGSNSDMIDSFIAEFFFRKHVSRNKLGPFHKKVTAIGKFQHSIMKQKILQPTEYE